ncbi:hypothetical protein C9I56_08050 [Paraburkholderia caribensis]|uniref:Uncharacterized protein n=1 Tax=Paraburkholderia caribensis TaxID=75105 RepID=A0A9Q6S2P5_9BURK|nr:hypothetical protein C9I56_08050 [Paraburkholderia caribensis]QLB63440.1 hypothetical protein A9O66_14235 [Paraburkholderia caribensis]
MRGARKRRISACGNPPRPDGWPLWPSHFGISRDALWRGALPGQGAGPVRWTPGAASRYNWADFFGLRGNPDK